MQNTKETIEQVQTYPIRAIPDRGITKETCEHFGVRVSLSETDGRTITAIYFPWTKDGKLVAYKKKDLTIPKTEKFHFTAIGPLSSDCDLFGQAVSSTGGKKSFTVEGEFDVLAAWQILKEKYPAANPAVTGIGGTSWGGKIVAKNKDYFKGFHENIFALDMDEATPEELEKGVKKGKEATADIAMVMTGIKVAEYSEHDPNDMLLKNKAEEFYWALMKPEDYVPEEIITGADINFDDIMRPLKEGVYLDFLPKTMQKLHGLRPAELTIILAPTKSGKTTITKQTGYELVKKGHAVGHYFLEEDLKKTAQSYVALDNNVLLPAFREDTSLIPAEKAQKSYNELIANGRSLYMKANKITPKNTLSTMRYMAAMGCKFIILDHLSYVFSGDDNDNERKAIDLLLHELAAFKKEANVHVIVVAHIKRKDFRPKTNKDGEVEYPYWIPVHKEDGRGSGAFEQLCDNLITIEPEIVNEGGERGRIRIKVAANREWDLTGIADVIIMDRKTGHMVNADNEVYTLGI